MRKLVIVVALLAGTVVTDLTLAPPAGATEILVGNAAAYRNALTTLSADTGIGPHVVRLTSDITLVADIEPVYTGSRQLVIDGDGHTIDGNDLNRIVDHQSTARLTVRDITIQDGHTPPGNDGGAIAVDGPLTISDATFEDNVADSNGGAIETSTSAVTITDSTFTGNSASHIGGVIEGNAPMTITGSTFDDNHVDDPLGVAASSGGALSMGGSGDSTITDTTFSGNSAVDPMDDVAGGAITTNTDGTVTLTRVTFTENSVNVGRGGAIDGGSAATIVIDDSTFTDNHVDGGTSLVGGGAIETSGELEVTDSTFEGNETTGGSGGAILLNANGTAVITGSDLVDNRTVGSTGDGGGAIRHVGNGLLTVVSSTLSGNTTNGSSTDGGAISGEHVVVTGSDLRDNAVLGISSSGGAISAEDLDLTDSWIVDNHADTNGGSGGGVDGGTGGFDQATITRSLFLRNTADGTSGTGGAIAFVDDLSLTNSTFFDNSAASSGGALTVPSSGEALVQHVSLGRNSAPTGAQLRAESSSTLTVEASVLGLPQIGVDCVGTITSGGHNRESGTSCGFTQPTDGQDLADPLLGPLRPNGGATSTFFPLNGSAVVDQIPAGQCDLDEDQRGVERPFGGGCDIGATEQVFPEHGFTDVPNWVEDAVRWMAWPGNDPQIMVGITPTRFEPTDPITRAQVVRMLYNEAGAPDASVYPPHGFTDVAPWVEDAVRWAKGEGIVDGVTPTTFVPDDPITRAQVVRMKYRFAGSPDVSAIDPHPFTDVPAWVEEAVTWAADPDNALPLVTGITPTTFEPTEDITRAQVARMDWRLALTPDAWADPGAAPRAMLFVAGA